MTLATTTYAQRVHIYPMERKRLVTLTTHRPHLSVPGLSRLQFDAVWRIFFFSLLFILYPTPLELCLGLFFIYTPFFFFFFFVMEFDRYIHTAFQSGVSIRTIIYEIITPPPSPQGISRTRHFCSAVVFFFFFLLPFSHSL